MGGYGRWVAVLVARLLSYDSSLGSNADISQKYKIFDISKGVANTLKLDKKRKKIGKFLYLLNSICYSI